MTNQKNKEIEKIKISGDWRSIAFVDQDKLVEAAIKKINEIIDYLNDKRKW